MSESKHTGWMLRAVADIDFSHEVHDAGGKAVAAVYDGNDQAARLIAAAPDLLAALKRADRELDDEACVNRISRARAIIQAAITRVEGRS